MDLNNHQKALGVGPGSSPEEIKKNYRALVRKYHPDNPNTGDPDKFREIHHAYKMLTDPSYSYKEEPKIQPIILKTSIKIEQAVFGSLFVHELTKVNPAVQKEGTEEPEATVRHTALELIDKIPKGTLKFPHAVVRNNMDFDNQKITIIVTYNLEEHPYYKVSPDGQMYVNLELEPMQALKGTKVEIQTLFGLRKLRIPAGTVPGDSFLIKKHGHLDPLMVKISDIRYPRKAEMKDNSNYSSLNIDWANEEELEKKELEDLDSLFDKLGGKPKGI